MKKILLALSLLLLFTACNIQDESTPTVEKPKVNVTGKITIPNDYGITSSRNIDNLTGDVIILIGDHEVTIPASEIEVDTENLKVPFDEEVNFEGLVVITYVSKLNYNDTPITSAGSVMTVVKEDEVNNINDVDKDGVVEENEEAETFTQIEILEDVVITELPIIKSFEVSETETDTAVVNISASFSNVNISSAVLRVNDSFRVIDLYIENGEASFQNKEIPLSNGDNQLQIILVNTVGMVESETLNVNYTADIASLGESILVTLDWDSPTSDMDLHTFYFEETNPTSESKTAWQNSWWNVLAPLRDFETEQLTGNLTVNETIDGVTTQETYSKMVLHHYIDEFDQYFSLSSLDGTFYIDINGDFLNISELSIGTHVINGEMYIDYFPYTVTGSMKITAMDEYFVTGVFTINYEIEDFETSAITKVTKEFILDGVSTSKHFDKFRKLDVDDTEGYGPEHFTLNNPEDGYYSVAVNSFSLDMDLETNCFVTIETATETMYYGPLNFITDNGESYPVNNSDSWYRIADIRVKNGTAEIIDFNEELKFYYYEPESRSLNIPSTERKVKK